MILLLKRKEKLKAIMEFAFMAVRRLWTGMNKAQRLEAKAAVNVNEKVYQMTF